MNANQRDLLNEIATLKKQLETLAKLTGFWCNECDSLIEPTKCYTCKAITCEKCSKCVDVWGDILHFCSESCYKECID